MELMGITDAKDKLSFLVERLERTTIIKNNAPVAVLVPIADYRVLERAELLLQDPLEFRRILERHQGVLEGRHEGFVELDELRARHEAEEPGEPGVPVPAEASEGPEARGKAEASARPAGAPLATTER